MKWRGKNNPQRLVVYSLLQELARRDGLSIALSGRNEKELYPILLFTRFSILEPKFSSFMLDVFDLILGEKFSLSLSVSLRLSLSLSLPPSLSRSPSLSLSLSLSLYRYLWRHTVPVKEHIRSPGSGEGEDREGVRVPEKRVPAAGNHRCPPHRCHGNKQTHPLFICPRTQWLPWKQKTHQHSVC